MPILSIFFAFKKGSRKQTLACFPLYKMAAAHGGWVEGAPKTSPQQVTQCSGHLLGLGGNFCHVFK